MWKAMSEYRTETFSIHPGGPGQANSSDSVLFVDWRKPSPLLAGMLAITVRRSLSATVPR